jgi:hypothetical protein
MIFLCPTRGQSGIEILAGRRVDQGTSRYEGLIAELQIALPEIKRLRSVHPNSSICHGLSKYEPDFSMKLLWFGPADRICFTGPIMAFVRDGHPLYQFRSLTNPGRKWDPGDPFSASRKERMVFSMFLEHLQFGIVDPQARRYEGGHPLIEPCGNCRVFLGDHIEFFARKNKQ